MAKLIYAKVNIPHSDCPAQTQKKRKRPVPVNAHLLVLAHCYRIAGEPINFFRLAYPLLRARVKQIIEQMLVITEGNSFRSSIAPGTGIGRVAGTNTSGPNGVSSATPALALMYFLN